MRAKIDRLELMIAQIGVGGAVGISDLDDWDIFNELDRLSDRLRTREELLGITYDVDPINLDDVGDLVALCADQTSAARRKDWGRVRSMGSEIDAATRKIHGKG